MTQDSSSYSDDGSASGSADDASESGRECSPSPTPSFTLVSRSASSSPRGRSWLRNGAIDGWGGEPESETIRKYKATNDVQDFTLSSIGTVWALTTVAIDLYKISKNPKVELKNTLFTIGVLLRLVIGCCGAKDMATRFYAMIHPLDVASDRFDMSVLMRKSINEVLSKLMAVMHYCVSGKPIYQHIARNSQLASNKMAVAEAVKGFAPICALLGNLLIASVKARGDSSSQAFSEFAVIFPLTMVPTLVLHLKMMTMQVEPPRDQVPASIRSW